MKKQLLIGSVLFAAISTYSQNNRVRPHNDGIKNTAEKVAQKFAVDAATEQGPGPQLKATPSSVPANPANYSQESVSAPPSSINWSLLCGSMNCYGMLVSSSRPLQYNANVNAVSFIHRKSTTYNETPAIAANAKSGVIVAEVSTNWGATWDSTAIFSNATDWARYPQGAIYSAPGNTNIANAYVVASGPATNAGSTWGAAWYASKQLGVAGSPIYNTTASAAPGAQQSLSTASPTYAPNQAKHGWTRDGFTSTDDGYVRGLGMLLNDQGAGTGMRGFAIVKGTYNAGVFNWTTDTINPTTVVTGAGAKVLAFDGQMAWNKSGTVGYVVGMGALSNASLCNRSYQPIIYKTTNSGASWGIVPGVDFNSNTPDVNMVLAPLSAVVSGTDTIALPYFNDYDLVVDSLDKLHIGATIYSGAIAHNDSLNYVGTYTLSTNGPTVKYYFPHRPGRRPFLYDFYGDGSSAWKVKLVDSIPTEDPGSATSSSGYADNPWDPTGVSSAKINMDSRIQLGRTPNGNYLTFSWSESDTNFTANAKKWNLLPNIKTRLMRVGGANPYNVSPVEINVSKPAAGQGTVNTNVAFRSTLHYMSPTTSTAAILSSPTTLTVDINTPFTVTNSNPYAQLTNCTTWYTAAKLSYTFNTTIIGVETNAANSANASVLYPNPAQGNATLLIDLKDNSSVNLSVYNMVGQLVKSVKAEGQQGTNGINIDLNNLTSGIYMVNVKVGNTTSTKKLIVQ